MCVSAMQHLLVIVDPVHLMKQLLSILTSKVYDRQAEGEGDGCINSGTQPSTHLYQIAFARLRVCKGHAANCHDGIVGCSALNWVHMLWHCCALISTVWADQHEAGAQHFLRKSIWKVQMFKGWLHPKCSQQPSLKIIISSFE